MLTLVWRRQQASTCLLSRIAVWYASLFLSLQLEQPNATFGILSELGSVVFRNDHIVKECSHKSALPSLVLPPLGTNLAAGFTDTFEETTGCSTFAELLGALKLLDVDFSQFHVISFRHNLTNIMVAPYFTNEVKIPVCRSGIWIIALCWRFAFCDGSSQGLAALS